MKIALMSLLSSEQMRAREEGWHTFNDLEPFGLECVGAIAKQEGHDVKLFHPYQSANPTEQELTRNILSYRPDVLGISSLTNTFPRSMTIAREIKRNMPKVKVVLGGDHITSYPKDVENNPEIDIAVRGEGETTFRELLQNNFQNLEIPGIAYSKAGSLRLTPWRNRSLTRADFPRAIRDREILAKSRVGSLMFPSLSKQTGAASLMLNFGCPLGCTYCTETTVGKGKVGKDKPDNVVQEIGQLKQDFGVNTAMFTDLTFNLYSERAEELCKKLAKASLGVNWYSMLRVTSPNGTPLVKNSLLEAMVAGGASKIAFGIESTQNEAIRDYNRSVSIDEDERVLREIDRLGALSKVFLIIGHPKERRDYYDLIIQNLKRLTPDEVRISYITPFPGTEIWKSKIETSEWKLTSKNWSEYTTFQQVLEMEHSTKGELDIQRKRILKEYYSSPEFERHWKQKISANPHLEQSYREFFEFLNTQKVI